MKRGDEMGKLLPLKEYPSTLTTWAWLFKACTLYQVKNFYTWVNVPEMKTAEFANSLDPEWDGSSLSAFYHLISQYDIP